MKKILYILIFCIIASTKLIANNFDTMEFVTLGNCFSCKLRIEEVVNKLPGIDSVYWSEEKKTTRVEFDTTKINIHQIMKIIADRGHDTEWYRGNDIVYNYQLIGTCCEYKRTIDYSKAKIGYLSLMDRWVGVENDNSLKTTITMSNNSINYTLSPLIINGSVLKIYNLNGSELSRVENLKTEGTVDMSNFGTGVLIINIENQNKIVFQTKIIK